MPWTAQQMRDWREAQRKAGLCEDCPDPALPGRNKCQAHVDIANAATRRATARKKEAGLCTVGGCGDPPEDGKTMCRPHLNEVNARSRAIRERKKAERRKAGLCEKCGERKPRRFGLAYCEVCLAIGRADNRRRRQDRAASEGKRPGRRREPKVIVVRE